MGGDFGPSVTVPAALRALAAHNDLNLLLVGDEPQIKALLTKTDANLLHRLEILHTSVCVENDSKPESVLRSSKESSMFLAVNLVKEGRANACVSAGNTGALLLAGRHLLKTIPGISKPAIIASIPLHAMRRNAYILDVGANVYSDAKTLQEFAIMGSIQAGAVNHLEKPRVALLNVGHEEHKGTATIREAAALLQQTESLHYVGFVEGNEIFMDTADVVVCDGFSGNITIKTSAGVVRVIEQLLKAQASRSLFSRFLSLLASPLLKQLRRQLDPAQFNGASVLGLQGIIVKSHGHARSHAFYFAIEQALKEVIDCVPEQIAERMKVLGAQTSTTSG
jgi:glycerol-3-phosphate acyltransferase PlsX